MYYCRTYRERYTYMLNYYKNITVIITYDFIITSVNLTHELRTNTSENMYARFNDGHLLQLAE